MNIYFTSIKGRRKSNEDRHNIILNTNEFEKINDTHNIDGSIKTENVINLLGIYDGHGGTYVSNYLQNNLPTYYCNKELKAPFSTEYHEQVFENLQKKILSHAEGYSSGSTCIMNIMYHYNDEIHMNIINLGDGRLCIVYKDGTCKQITTDHKPDDKIEKKRIEQMGGEIYADTEGTIRIGDLSLSRAFGDGDNAPYISQKPDVYYNKITSNTSYIIMACDGLWDVINNEDLSKLMAKFISNGSVNLAADLANEALNKGTSDNVSIIIVQLI